MVMENGSFQEFGDTSWFQLFSYGAQSIRRTCSIFGFIHYPHHAFILKSQSAKFIKIVTK